MYTHWLCVQARFDPFWFLFIIIRFYACVCAGVNETDEKYDDIFCKSVSLNVRRSQIYIWLNLKMLHADT